MVVSLFHIRRNAAGCGSHMVWERSTTFPTKANSSGEKGRIGKNVDRSYDVSQNQRILRDEQNSTNNYRVISMVYKICPTSMLHVPSAFQKDARNG